MTHTFEAPGWREYDMRWHEPHRQLEPLEREITIIDDAITALANTAILPYTAYDKDRFLAHRADGVRVDILGEDGLPWLRTFADEGHTIDLLYTRRYIQEKIGDKDRGIPQLRACFPLAVAGPQLRYEIPFGSIRRDLVNGEEVVAQRWADVSAAGGQGVTLVLTLLRASIDYALVPHGAGWSVGDSTQAGEALNIPPRAASKRASRARHVAATSKSRCPPQCPSSPSKRRMCA